MNFFKRVIAFVSSITLVAGMFLQWNSFEVLAAENTKMEDATKNVEKTREILNFNNDWGFFRGDLEGAEGMEFDDSEFVNVTIPHTMRLEKKHNNTTNGVYKEIGWYRRYFTLDKSYEGKKLQLQFEGVMTDSDIYLNGEKVYTRNGGYIGFNVDITDKVKFGEDNVLAVRVSNVDNPNTPPGKPDSRLDFHYYGGIYRDVMLTVSEKTYITDPLEAEEVAGGGVFVKYSDVSDKSAKVNVKTHVKNDNLESKNVYTNQVLRDKEGNTVVEMKSEENSIVAGEGYHFEQEFTVDNPTLWDVDNPYLYSLVTEVYEDDVKVDEVTNKIGIRTIAYKPDGFYLNGKRVYLRGANRHQSYQNIGDAAPNSMQRRDALLMKENGFNAVRATHYPQDPAFLDACDEIGLLVIECQPGWQNFTNTDIFYQRTLRDTREMVRRDRNRPSVVLWETSLNETPYSEQWAKDATKAAHEEYPGDQLFTAADYGYHGSFYDVGYKVQDTQWSNDPADWVDYNPNKPFLTREWGDYEGASKALRKDGEAAMNTQVLTRQRYLNGNGYSDWGGLDASDRIGGYFLWSWNDYTRGSTTETLGSGTVDIDRYEKNGFYWLQSMQPHDNPVYGPMIYISSDYTENSSLKIPVYSNCESVKLYQNNELVDEITREEAGRNIPNIMKKDGSPIFEFSLSEFKAGTLKVEGIVNGSVVTSHEVSTPEETVKLEVEIRDRGIEAVADGSDLVPVYVKAVDKNGTVVPDFNGKVHIEVSGQGTLVGENIPRIKVEDQILEKGIGFAFIRTTDVAGDITITATSEGIENGVKTIATKECKDTFVPNGNNKGWENGEDSLEEAVLENIAVGKPVTVSSEQSGNYGKNIVDDDEGTRWCASNGKFPQWVEIDLQNVNAIAGFQMLWENPSSVYKYSIETSNDGINWNTVVDKTGNTEVNTSQETQMVKTKGRFIRLNILSSNEGWASLYEFRVVPDRDAEPTEPGEVILDDMIEEIIASEGSVEGRGTELVRDGETIIGSGWLSPSSNTFPQTLEVKFKKPQTLLGSAIYWEKDSTKITYDIEVSKDGENWMPIMTDLEETWHDEEPETFEEIQENIISIRAVMKGKDPAEAALGMAEWKLYGYTYEEGEVDPEPEKEFEHVSDLEWESAYSDYGSVKKDEAAYGGPLVLNTEDGERTFERGLGADTNSEIIYNIEGKKYYKFESYIGINKKASKNGGEAIFKVYIDDELIYTSPVKMRDDNCEFISLDIPENAKKIKLEAKWSENNDNPEARYNTHVNWADAKFIINTKKIYQVTATSENEEMGTVSLNSDSGIYEKGKEAIVTATAKEGYEFVGWMKEGSEEIVSEKANYEFIVESDIHLIAKFKEIEEGEVDKTELNRQIEIAEVLVKDKYTEETWSNLQKALEEAKKVSADENSLVKEVKEAHDKLVDSISKLEVKPESANKLNLKNMIEKVEALNNEEYIPSTLEKVEEALAYARDIYEKENAIQSEVDEVEEALLRAYLDLRLKPDKSKLEDLINKVNGMDLSRYTDKTVENLKTALNRANEVLNDEEVTKSVVEKAVKDLELAVSGLEEKKEDESNSGNNNNNDNSNNQGNNGSNNSGNKPNEDSGKGGKLPSTGAAVSSSLVLLLGIGAVIVGGVTIKKRKRE